MTSSTAACLGPPVAVETAVGVARAGDRETAERVALALEVGPTIRERIDSTRSRRPAVWALDISQAENGGATASCYWNWIELTREALRSVDLVVAHELVHWYGEDSPYESLPYFLWEGLAEFVSSELLGVHEERFGDVHALESVTMPQGLLFAGVDVVWSRPAKERNAHYLIGYWTVRRLGLDRLRELAEARALPLEYIEAAGITATPTDASPERDSPRLGRGAGRVPRAGDSPATQVAGPPGGGGPPPFATRRECSGRGREDPDSRG